MAKEKQEELESSRGHAEPSPNRIQTAEGWKKEQIKKRKSSKTKSKS